MATEMFKMPWKTDPHKALAVLARGLERFPWASLDRGLRPTRIEVPFSDDKEWVATSDVDTRLPGPFEADLYIALCQCYHAAGWPDDQTFTVPVTTVAKLMHRPASGKFYAAIEAGVQQLAGVRIRQRGVWKDGTDQVRDVQTIHILDGGTRMWRDNQEKSFLTVTFSRQVAHAVAQKIYRLLDPDQYFALKLPVAKRLFRYLSYRRYRRKQAMTDVQFPLRTLALELPLGGRYPSVWLQTLTPGHQELLDRGFLLAATVESHQIVRYELAAVRERRARSTTPADDVGVWARDVCSALDDTHSAANWIQVGTAMSESQREFLLAEIREDRRSARPAPAKVWNATARKRAGLSSGTFSRM